MLQSSIVINSLFKTIEYKLISSNNLELNVLSKSGSLDSKTISLNSIYIEEGQTTPPYLSWLVLFLGSIFIAITVHSSKEISIINNNLGIIISFLTCVFGALAILCKPTKTIKYLDSFSNNILFKFNENSINNSSTKQFVKDLNTAIHDAKQIETERSNSKSNSQMQYEKHSENVDELLNSGLIDEALYNRICSSMYEKFEGSFTKSHFIDNVVYLKR